MLWTAFFLIGFTCSLLCLVTLALWNQTQTLYASNILFCLIPFLSCLFVALFTSLCSHGHATRRQIPPFLVWAGLDCSILRLFFCFWWSAFISAALSVIGASAISSYRSPAWWNHTTATPLSFGARLRMTTYSPLTVDERTWIASTLSYIVVPVWPRRKRN